LDIFQKIWALLRKLFASDRVSRLGFGRAGLRGGTGAIAPAPRCKGAPRDEIYLFQIKYSFEKFRDSAAIHEYNSILYSYVA